MQLMKFYYNELCKLKHAVLLRLNVDGAELTRVLCTFVL